MKKLISFAIILFIFTPISFSQNKVWLIDGTVYKSDGQGIVDSNKVVIIDKKIKSKLIDTSDVFAIISDLDTMFLYSSTEYPLEKAKFFMQGQIDGKSYKNTDVYVGAFVVGVASPILLNSLSFLYFLAPVISTSYTAVFSTINMDIPHEDYDTRYKDNESYIRGYRLSATKEKVKKMSAYSIVGLVTGVSILFLVQ
ncbi:MAG: hypothetical protein U9Q83_12465 [Bacteroidota bacterium]|nr:hypothetical protein [Bacteroidota bacterium]